MKLQWLILPFLLFLSTTGLSSCAGDAEQATDTETVDKTASKDNPYADAKVKIELFEGDAGWGYDVYLNGKHYIHQPHKPAVMGRNGFATKDAAERTARLVQSKIKKGVMPPAVTPEELDSLLK